MKNQSALDVALSLVPLNLIPSVLSSIFVCFFNIFFALIVDVLLVCQIKQKSA